ncbi:odorant receptor 13a-like isoform X1 [Vespula squamosa]|uniref:Odorant receptor 13a-like isoform X1 n=1 Tax=Vespula squamosa TaxID=30214 RepID=A0ABD2A883_VESSQ
MAFSKDRNETFVSIVLKLKRLDLFTDLDYAIGWNRFNLEFLGVWPDSDRLYKNIGFKRHRWILHAFFMLGFIILPQSAYLVMIWGDLDLMTEDLATANVPVTMACIKLFVIWYHLKSEPADRNIPLNPLLCAFVDDWNRSKSEQERTIMLSNARKARTISMLCTVMIQIMTTTYILLRIGMIAQMQKDQMEPDRTLICPAYFPYDVRRTPVFYLTCTGQILAAYSATVSYTGVDSFISMLVLHVCAQISNLRSALKTLVDERSTEDRKVDNFVQKLALIVKRHEHLNRLTNLTSVVSRRFARSIEDSFNVLMLVQILTCTMQVCFQSYQVLAILGENEDEFPTVQLCFLVLFVAVTLVNAIPVECQDDILTTRDVKQSSGMSESAYESKWCNLSPKDARNLLFVMHRSTIPLRLTAGKFSTFSMKTSSELPWDTFRLYGWKTQMDYAIGWNRFNLSVLGVWPEPSKTTLLWRLTSASIFWTSTTVTFLFICAPQTTDLILNSTTLDEAIENLSINIPIAFAVIKQIVLWYHGDDLRSLLVEIVKDWAQTLREPERLTMLRNAKMSRKISLFCSTLTYLMLTAFISLQTYANMASASEVDLGGLLHPATFPYDTKKSPYFEITWMGQFMGTVLTAICYSCFDTFLAVFVLHLCGQLSVLQMNLKELAEIAKRDVTSFQNRLGFIVNRHNELYRFAIIVENCFNLTLLGQTLISTAMFCLTGYRMITSIGSQEQDLPVVGMIFFIIHVIYTMLHLYIYCYVGETLLVEVSRYKVGLLLRRLRIFQLRAFQSTGIAFSAYDCEWYDLPPKKAMCLMIVICRARIAFQITAGKFSPFSLELFGAIMKTSAGYLSVLLAVKEGPAEEQ